MYCIHCGARLEGTPKFCYRCGQPVSQPEERQELTVEAKGPSAEGAVHAPKPRRPRRMRAWTRVLLILFLVLLSAVLVGTGAVVGMGLHRVDQLARIVPADTPVFISLCPTLLHLPQLRYVDNLRKAAGVFAVVPAALDLDEWLGPGDGRSLDVDLQRDVLPWIGREVSLALVNDADGNPQILFAAATRNKRGSDRFLSHLRSQFEDMDVDFRATVYRDVQITEVVPPGPPWAYATVKHMVLVASDVNALCDAIDRAADGSTAVLRDKRSFRTALGDLPRSRLGYVYLDWADLPQDLSENLDQAVPFLVTRFQAMETFAAAPQLGKDGLSIAYVTHYDLSRLSADHERELRQAADMDRLIALAPTDSIAYLSGRNLPVFFEALGADLPEELGSLMTQAQDAEFVDSLLSEMSGEYACFLSADSSGLLGQAEIPVGILFLFQIEDRQLMESTLGALAPAIAQDAYVDLRSDEINGATVWLLEDPSSEAAIGFGLTDDAMFLASSRNMLAVATASGGSELVDSALFQAATGPLPHPCRGQGYVDVHGALELADAFLGEADREQFDTIVRPYIEPILALSTAAEPMDKTGALRGTVFVHTAAQ